MIFKTPSLGSFYVPTPHLPRIKATYRVRFVAKGHRVIDYMARWERNFLYRAGGSIRAWIIKAAKRKKDKNVHSPHGTPPFAHLKKSEFLRPAIQFAVNLARKYVLVGTAYKACRLWGWKHEFGKLHKGAQFPKRPFVNPEFQRWLKHERGLPYIMKETKEWAFKR